MNKTKQILTVCALSALTLGAVNAAPAAEQKKEAAVATTTKTIELNVKGMM
jgi:hypothetical protein